MKNHHKKAFTRILSLTALGALVAVQFYPFVQSAAAATQITNRDLTLKAGAADTDGNGIPDGGSLAGGTVAHDFSFELDNTTDPLGSIKFQYCTTAAPVPGGIDCVSPTGINTQNANLFDQTGATGFTGITQGSEDDGSTGTFNTIVISRGAAATLADADDGIGTEPDGNADTPASYEFTQVVNPSTVNETFFVRITTYASLDGTGTVVESGTVAASTAEPIELSGTMPESLVFCTGRSISETNNVPDCSTATAGIVGFNQLFSPTVASWATSQMAASTNAGEGYAITVNGPTLTSGSNTITAIGATADISKPGQSQFGMNVMLNAAANSATPPPVPASADVTTPTAGTLHNGQAVAPYSVGDATADGTNNAQYAFETGNIVANSNSLASDPQVFTATYMVNVPGSQPAGTYTTTLTYICTATF